MKKHLVFLASGVLALLGLKGISQEQKLNSTIDLAQKASRGKSSIEIKPVDKMLLAPQDISGGGKGRRTKKTIV